MQVPITMRRHEGKIIVNAPMNQDWGCLCRNRTTTSKDHPTTKEKVLRYLSLN